MVSIYLSPETVYSAGTIDTTSALSCFESVLDDKWIKSKCNSSKKIQKSEEKDDGLLILENLAKSSKKKSQPLVTNYYEQPQCNDTSATKSKRSLKCSKDNNVHSKEDNTKTNNNDYGLLISSAPGKNKDCNRSITTKAKQQQSFDEFQIIFDSCDSIAASSLSMSTIEKPKDLLSISFSSKDNTSSSNYYSNGANYMRHDESFVLDDGDIHDNKYCSKKLFRSPSRSRKSSSVISYDDKENNRSKNESVTYNKYNDHTLENKYTIKRESNVDSSFFDSKTIQSRMSSSTFQLDTQTKSTKSPSFKYSSSLNQRMARIKKLVEHVEFQSAEKLKEQKKLPLNVNNCCEKDESNKNDHNSIHLKQQKYNDNSSSKDNDKLRKAVPTGGAKPYYYESKENDHNSIHLKQQKYNDNSSSKDNDKWRKVVPTDGAKPYYYNQRTRESSWALPKDATLVTTNSVSSTSQKERRERQNLETSANESGRLNIYCTFCGIKCASMQDLYLHISTVKCDREWRMNNSTQEWKSLQKLMIHLCKKRSKKQQPKSPRKKQKLNNASHSSPRNHYPAINLDASLSRCEDDKERNEINQKIGNNTKAPTSLSKNEQDDHNVLATCFPAKTIEPKEDKKSPTSPPSTQQINKTQKAIKQPDNDYCQALASTCPFCAKSYPEGQLLSKHLLGCKRRRETRTKRLSTQEHNDHYLTNESPKINGEKKMMIESLIYQGGRHLPGYPKHKKNSRI